MDFCSSWFSKHWSACLGYLRFITSNVYANLKPILIRVLLIFRMTWLRASFHFLFWLNVGQVRYTIRCWCYGISKLISLRKKNWGKCYFHFHVCVVNHNLWLWLFWGTFTNYTRFTGGRGPKFSPLDLGMQGVGG